MRHRVHYIALFFVLPLYWLYFFREFYIPRQEPIIMILSSNEVASRFEILLTSSDFPYPSTLHPISPAGSYPFIEDQRYLSRHPLILSLVLFFFLFFSVSLSRIHWRDNPFKAIHSHSGIQYRIPSYPPLSANLQYQRREEVYVFLAGERQEQLCRPARHCEGSRSLNATWRGSDLCGVASLHKADIISVLSIER